MKFFLLLPERYKELIGKAEAILSGLVGSLLAHSFLFGTSLEDSRNIGLTGMALN